MHLLAFIGAATLLCSCRSLQAGGGYRQPEPYYLTNDLKLPLLDTALLDSPLDLAQHIKGSYKGKVYFLDAYAKADAASLDMVALDAMGTQVFDLAYSKAKGIRFSSALGVSGTKPEYIVADFQLAYYPFEAVKAALATHGLDFSQRTEDGRSVRSLSFAGREIVRIETLPEGFRYDNLLRGYSYEITESR
jgi:hypothetical protein